MSQVYVSLGSNVDPEQHLRDALTALRQRFGGLEVSSTYRSAAVGFVGAPFLNVAVAFDCGATRASLREWLHNVEDAAGRDRSLPRYADRTLDLDVALWCEDCACTTDLTCEEFERAHVLAPLAELAPEVPDPFRGQPLAERWRELAPTLPALERVASRTAESGRDG